MSLAAAAPAALSLPARRRPLVDSRYIGALVGMAWLVPILATVVTIASYTAPAPYPAAPFDLFHQYPVVAGAVTSVVAWLILSIFYAPFASAAEANGSSFGDLQERLAQLTVRLETWSAGCGDRASASAFQEARARRDLILADLPRGGVRWVLSSGYVTAWKDLHRAEEALLTVAPLTVLVGEALYDEWRLTGSNIDQHDNLLALLQKARHYIEPATLDDSPVAATPSSAVGLAAPPLSTEALKDVRTIIAKVRRSVNEFRDSRWSGLIRSRNLLMGTMVLTELFAYGLLGLVLTVQPPISSVTAAFIFFLVGAVIGLFNRLSKQEGTGSTLDDYSLAKTRLILTPVFTGLSAVAGVLLTAIVTTSGLTNLASSTGSTVKIPPLMDIFNLDKFRLGLPLAALFGWAPGLLVGRLQQMTDQYKVDIKSSEASTETSKSAPSS